jgi:F-type H+-transporting ATPase subunit b
VTRALAAFRLALFGLALVAVVPSMARAEEEAAAAHEGGGHEGGAEAEEAPKLDTGKLVLQLINFAVLAGVIGFFGGKAVNKALVARHQQMKADLQAASEARAAAEARAAEQAKRLERLESEIASIRANIKKEAEDEKARLIAAAEERAKGIAAETQFLLDQQVKEAEVTLRREVGEAALKVATDAVTKALTGSDQQRLVDAFVSDVTTPAGNAGRSA